MEEHCEQEVKITNGTTHEHTDSNNNVTADTSDPRINLNQESTNLTDQGSGTGKQDRKRSLSVDSQDDDFRIADSTRSQISEMSQKDILNLLDADNVLGHHGDNIAGGNGHRGGESDQMPPPNKRNKVNNIRDEELVIGNNCEEGDQECDNENLEHNGNGLTQIDLFGKNVEVRLLISSRDAGAIIGRGGSNITHLRKTFDAQLTVPDCPSPERVLTVVASIEKVAKIVREILKFTEPFYSSLVGQKSGYYESRASRENLLSKFADKGRVSLKPTDTEIRVLLHTSHAGGLIGKGGARITQLRRTTGSGIKIFSDCCPMSTERVCIIYGQPETVVGAVKAIVELVSTFPVKGPTTLYDPKNVDSYINYGGFIINPGAGQGGVHSPPGSITGIPGPILPPPSYGGGRGGDGGRGGGRNSMLPMPPPSIRDNYGGMPSPLGSGYYGGSGRRHSGGSSAGGYSHNSPISSSRLPPSSPLLPSGGGPPGSGSSYSSPWSARMVSDYSSGGSRGGRADSYLNLTQVSSNLSYCGGGTGSALKQIRTVGNSDRSASSFLDEMISSIVSNNDGTSTATISVPNVMVGAIMGKGGYRIKEIRLNSMAEINIAKSKSPDNNRLITVKGLHSDVQRAVGLIKKSIDANTY